METLVQPHDYTNNCNVAYENDAALYYVYHDLKINLRQFNKPYWIGEDGVHLCAADGVSDLNATVDSTSYSADTQGKILRSEIWGAFMASAGGLAPWNYFMTANVTAFKGLSSFVNALPTGPIPDSAAIITNYNNMSSDVMASDPKLEVIGRKNSDYAIIRVQNTTGTWAAILRDHQTPIPIGGTITLKGMNQTSFSIKWIDTITGNNIKTESVTASANGLVLTLPNPITEDIAAIITNGSLPSSTPTQTVTLTPTSGPSNTPTDTLFPTPSPTSNTFCGAPCQTNADCDQSGLSCGICDADTLVCRSAVISPTQVPSQAQSPTPSASATPPSGSTIGTLFVHFEGIDPQNNATPHHPQRKVILSFYKTQNFATAADDTLTILVSFSSSATNGYFTNSNIDLSSIPQGNYYVLVKSPEGSLREQVSPQPLMIAKGQTVALNGLNNTSITLRMGDLDGDNQISLTDYNIFVDCYGTKASSSFCTQHNITDQILGSYADINDNGVVDGIDYNILIRNFGQTGY